MDLLGGLNRGLRQVLTARGVRSAEGRFGGHSAHYYSLDGKPGAAPVLLVHGLGGSANGFFKIFVALAARFSRVLALDLPGNGFSVLPREGPLSVHELLEVLRAFCVSQLGEPALVVGNSLGGAMAASLAATSPEWVKALALVSPAGAAMTEARAEALLGSFAVTNTQQARALTRRLFHTAPWAPLLFAGQLIKLYNTPAVRHMTSSIKAEDSLSHETLGALTMPTLLLWGEGEKLLPYEGIEYFRAHLPPTAEIEVVKGFGHMPQVERPAELLQRLIEFADRHRV